MHVLAGKGAEGKLSRTPIQLKTSRNQERKWQERRNVTVGLGMTSAV